MLLNLKLNHSNDGNDYIHLLNTEVGFVHDTGENITPTCYFNFISSTSTSTSLCNNFTTPHKPFLLPLLKNISRTDKKILCDAKCLIFGEMERFIVIFENKKDLTGEI